MVDYSKWDRWAKELLDSSDDDEEERRLEKNYFDLAAKLASEVDENVARSNSDEESAVDSEAVVDKTHKDDDPEESFGE